MAGASDLIQPNRMKLVLAVTLIVPVLFIFWLIPGRFPDEVILPVIVAIPVSYATACAIDALVQSRTAKIVIASVAALVSIILGYVFTQTMTMVCDPVHDPNIICDPVHVPDTTPVTMVPTVINTAVPSPVTPMIFDPVHEPGSCGQACREVIGNAAGTTDLVALKLEECLRNCGR